MTSSAEDKGSIVFYDIASSLPSRTFAPNPWKTRYALNFKGLPYQTKWIQMPDIPSVREKLGVPANRTLPDGSPYHTLPVIHDQSTGQIIGDTFEIAQYLDRAYPDTLRLIPTNTTGLTAALNQQVDKIFTTYIILADQMPFDPSVAQKVGEIFAKRAEIAGITDMELTSEAREELWVQFENALGEFAKAYHHVGGTTDYFWSKSGTAKAQAQKSVREQRSPFLDGDEPTYADFIVGAWFAAYQASMKSEDWQRVMQFQNGQWARMWEALAPFRDMR